MKIAVILLIVVAAAFITAMMVHMIVLIMRSKNEKAARPRDEQGEVQMSKGD